MIRTRFAPSPTGEFHVGSARTALFNWLYARRHGGVFILRLEDTDAARNTPEARAAIFDSLAWLGLDWDEGPLPENQKSEAGDPSESVSISNQESTINHAPKERGNRGPYCQSERGEIYQRHIERLLSEGKAYEEEGAVRFRMPKTTIRVNDAICGEIDFDLSGQEDLVIRRSNGAPVFHLVNVVDDLEMGVTHVLRGEDHLSNTPKHVALYEGLGAPAPHFAHIPLILNANGSKMSKRDQGATIAEYRSGGFLPEAVVNYLCLLGWSPPDDGQELLSLTEVATVFDLANVNRSNARFDPKKLLWMNGEYSRKQAPEAFTASVLSLLPDNERQNPTLRAFIPLYQDKVQVAGEVPPLLDYTHDDFSVESEGNGEIEEKVKKKLSEEASRHSLRELADALAPVEPFQAGKIEEAFHQLVEGSGKKIGAFMAPCRAAVTGQMGGPSLYHTLEILGKERTLARIKMYSDL